MILPVPQSAGDFLSGGRNKEDLFHEVVEAECHGRQEKEGEGVCFLDSSTVKQNLRAVGRPDKTGRASGSFGRFRARRKTYCTDIEQHYLQICATNFGVHPPY
jgi:hypothetical protein